jgi:hypothetical protein
VNQNVEDIRWPRCADGKISKFGTAGRVGDRFQVIPRISVRFQPHISACFIQFFFPEMPSGVKAMAVRASRMEGGRGEGNKAVREVRVKKFAIRPRGDHYLSPNAALGGCPCHSLPMEEFNPKLSNPGANEEFWELG